LDLAEVFAFHISRRLITLAAPLEWLPTAAGLERRFRGIDDRIREIYPAIADALQRTQQSGMIVAIRWELLIFADEHPLAQTLLIWDRVIARRAHAAEYIRALSLAHMEQVQITADGVAICEMRAPDEWDLPRIFQQANELLKSEPRPHFSWVATSLVAAIVFLSALSTDD
jgi:hypothetical protein